MPLAAAILLELAAAPAPGIVSLPRLAKRLGVRASVLLRELGHLGDLEIGGRRGPGWVRVDREGERWLVRLTAAGREVVAPAARPDDAAGHGHAAPHGDALQCTVDGSLTGT